MSISSICNNYWVNDVLTLRWAFFDMWKKWNKIHTLTNETNAFFPCFFFGCIICLIFSWLTLENICLFYCLNGVSMNMCLVIEKAFHILDQTQSQRIYTISCKLKFRADEIQAYKGAEKCKAKLNHPWLVFGKSRRFQNVDESQIEGKVKHFHN